MTDGAIAPVQQVAVPGLHQEPPDLSDRIALLITKCLRLSADLFFAKRHGPALGSS